jgi:hypothetical protein
VPDIVRGWERLEAYIEQMIAIRRTSHAGTETTRNQLAAAAQVLS